MLLSCQVIHAPTTVKHASDHFVTVIQARECTGSTASSQHTCNFPNAVESNLLIVRTIEICLIEDNPGDSVLVREVLRDYAEPVNVRVAHDGEQAVRMLADEHYEPDLIVLDLNIPKIPGLAVLALEQTRKAPVIVFSSAMDPAEIACAMQLGAKEFVRKPIDLKSFADAVRGMIDRWTERAEACGAV